MLGLAEHALGVARVAEVEGGLEDEVEEVVVLVEVAAEEAAVEVLEVVEGVEALEKAALELQGHREIINVTDQVQTREGNIRE